MADSLSSFTGLSSGMDWQSLVDQVVSLERRPAARMEATIAANTKRKDALGQFQTLVQGLQDAADRLARAGATSPFQSFAVSAAGTGANDRNVLAATAASGAEPGTYAVSVSKLATAQRWTAASGLAPTETLPEGATLTLGRPGPPPTASPTITVGADWTTARLRDEINALNTGATPSGVSAALITVSPTEQRLVLTATQPGAANGFTLDDGGTGLRAELGLDDAALDATPSLRQNAGDAEFSVGGIAMTRSTNVVTDALPGVTLTLATPGDSTVSVTRQASAASDAVQAFADAYNRVQSFVKGQSADRSAVLYNDPLLRSVRSNFGQTMVTAAIPGSQTGGAAGVADDLTTLSSLGLSLQKDGTLDFDATKFSAAANTRSADVQALLASRMGAFADQAGAIARPMVGLIDQREGNLEVQSAQLTQRVADVDARLEKRRAALVAQYARFESSLSRLKSIGDQMTAQFTALNASSRD